MYRMYRMDTFSEERRSVVGEITRVRLQCDIANVSFAGVGKVTEFPRGTNSKSQESG